MPSGGYLSEGDWLAVCELCRDRDLFLIYDSAMERLLFDDRPLIHPLRIDGMAERTVVVGSLSKEHRMIGWRVGWVAGPPDTVTDAGWAHVYNTTMPWQSPASRRRAVLRGDQGHVAECVAEDSSAAATQSSPAFPTGRSSARPGVVAPYSTWPRWASIPRARRASSLTTRRSPQRQ